MLISRRPGARFAVIATFLGLVTLVPMGTMAASCTGNSHTLTLSQGGVSPGSGSTSTTFTFEVTYTDTAGCAPNTIAVVVEGVGDINLKHDHGSLTDGAVFRARTSLPAGRRGYSFEATSGSGAGLRTAKLKNVSPAEVVVTQPPDPPAKPTPAPDKATPKPTPDPTRPPAPKPTPTDEPTPEPTRHTGSKGPDEPEPSAGAGDGPSPSPEATGRSAAVPAIGGSHGGASPDRAVAANEVSPVLLALVVASLGTVGGLVLFAILGTWLADPGPGRVYAAIGRRRPLAKDDPGRNP